jgi:hypothetical protein
MTCTCGFTLQAEQNYCSECGLPALSCKICKTDYASQKSKYCDECGSKRPEAKKRKTISLMDNLEHMKQLREWMESYPRLIISLIQNQIDFEDIKSQIHNRVKDRIQWISRLDIGQFLTLEDFSLFRRCCKSTLSWKQSTSWRDIVIGKRSLVQLKSFLPNKKRIPTLYMKYGKEYQKSGIDEFFHSHLYSFDTLDLTYSCDFFHLYVEIPSTLKDPKNFESVSELYCGLNHATIINAFLSTNSENKCLRIKWSGVEDTIIIHRLKSLFSYSRLPSSFFVQDRLVEFGCQVHNWNDLFLIWRPICVKVEIIRFELGMTGVNNWLIDDKSDEFKSHVSKSGDTFLRDLHITLLVEHLTSPTISLISICTSYSPKLQLIEITSYTVFSPPAEFSKLRDELSSCIHLTWKQK